MKVGDKVTVIGRGEVRFLGVIKRETEMYWIVGDYKFRKSDNEQPRGFSCGYCPCHIVHTTQEHIDSLRKRNLVSKLRNQSWPKLDLETLEKVFAIVGGMTDTKGTKTERFSKKKQSK